MIYINILYRDNGYNNKMLKEILKNIDMFTSLDSEEFNELVNITTLKTLQKDNILFYEGEIPDYFYLLLDRHIKLYKTNIKSQEIVLNLKL